MNIYRIYGKHKKSKMFRPMDYKNSTFVVNLLCASFFREEEKERLHDAVKELNELNPEYIFEVRKQVTKEN